MNADKCGYKTTIAKPTSPATAISRSTAFIICAPPVDVACVSSLVLVLPISAVWLCLSEVFVCSPGPLSLDVDTINTVEELFAMVVIDGLSPSDICEENVADSVFVGAVIVVEGGFSLADVLATVAGAVGLGKFGVDNEQLGKISMEIVASGM